MAERSDDHKLKRVLSYRIAVTIVLKGLLELAETGRLSERTEVQLREAIKHVA